MSGLKGSGGLFAAQIVAEPAAGVFVVVAVYAQVFPVASVRGVVLVVPVPVVNRQEVKVVLVELHPALGADPAVNVEGLAPVVGCIFPVGQCSAFDESDGAAFYS